MTVGKREQTILTGLYLDIEEAKQQEYRPTAREDYTEFQRVRDAENDMARINPGKWLNITVTSSQSVMNARSYKRLEKAGLIERVHSEYSTQTSRLRITESGKKEAKRLLAVLETTSDVATQLGSKT